jgi:dCMP deaminase
MTIRPNKWDYCLEIAAVVARRSTCPRLSVGAVIVTPEYQIISTGYNGAPAGADHCCDKGCAMDEAGHCTRAVHAEANAIVQAARHGAATRGCFMFATHQPCLRCTHLIINAGIKLVAYTEAYKDDATVAELARLCEVNLSQWKP